MPVIENQYICEPGSGLDGLGLCDGKHYAVTDCFIDLSKHDLDDIDEAVGITWGSTAIFKNCVIRGAGKLILLGCGDDDKVYLEYGKHVAFENCIFEDFGRRGPEVQDGMVCHLNNCLIRNWGEASRFSVRAFAGWAHGEGSAIIANNCIFMQENRFSLKHWILDKANHIGQAFNDEGFKGLFDKQTYISGLDKALVATDGGMIKATNCYFNPWTLHCTSKVTHCSSGIDENYSILYQHLIDMKTTLIKKLGIENERDNP